MFCTIIWSKIEANSNSEVEVESAHKPRGPSGQHLSCWVSVCSIKWLGVFLLPPPPPPRWDAIPSQGYPGFASTYNKCIYTPEWKEALWECLAQEHNTMFPARAPGQTNRNREEIQNSNNRLLTQTAYKF